MSTIYVLIPMEYKAKLTDFRSRALMRGHQFNEKDVILGLLTFLDDPKISAKLRDKIIEMKKEV